MPAYASPGKVDDDATQSALASLLTELGQKLEASDIAALATAAKQDTQTTALGNILTELAQKLEPSDLSSLATAANQTTANGKLDSLITELGQKLEPADLSALSTAANQVSTNAKLDSLLTELGQKLEPADISAIATAAKQDAAKAVLDTMSASLTTLHGDLDGVEALLTSIHGDADQLEGYVDNLESLISTLTTKLTDGSARIGGTSLVDSGAATPTAISSGAAVAAGATKLWGVSVRETAGSSAVIRLRDGVVGGVILATISLNAGESIQQVFAKPILVTHAGGVYTQLVSGTIPEGSVFTT